jgi:hypothetical protein
MAIEYHGWIVLAASQEAWSDGDFEEAVRQARDVLEPLSRQLEHDPLMPDAVKLPQMVYLKGCEADSLAPVLNAAREIGSIFDRAYGEILAFDDRGDQRRCWDFSLATRYRLTEGKLVDM